MKAKPLGAIGKEKSEKKKSYIEIKPTSYAE